VVAARWKLVRAIALILLGTGCFYVDPINQRPSADIQPEATSVPRGGSLTIDSVVMDPEGDSVFVKWRVYACTDASAPAGCDPDPFFMAATPSIVVTAPLFRAGGTTPVAALRVILEAEDIHGAYAKPSQEALIDVTDAGPSLTLGKNSGYGYVLGMPAQLYAKVGDADDGPTLVHLDWQVFEPAGATFTLADLTVPPDPNDPDHLQFGKTFTPSTAGDYDVQVKATDPAGMSVMQDLPVTIVPDHVPCLTSYTPLDAPAGQTLPLADPTLFQVLVVSDDLDPYPPVVGDPLRGTTSFSWSLLPPGATARQALDVIGNSVALDPASYNAGDIVELRVEIADRQHVPVNCADSSPTCSVISDSTCIQRLTWRVAVQ
jgi:hypothetical protein